MIHFIYGCLYLLLFAVIPIALFAKEDKVAYKADQLENAKIHDQDCKKLVGNVVFTFQPSGMVLTADKAYKYDAQERIEAHGNVKMMDKEGGIVQADLLTYYPEKKRAILEHNVCCSSNNSKFYTSKLIYNVATKQGKFVDNVKLVQGEMVLTSHKGVYDGVKHKVVFSKEVVLIDPSYTLYGTQLSYHTDEEKAYFHGSTKIVRGADVLLTEQGGSYLLPTKHLVMRKGKWTGQDSYLTADRLEMLDNAHCVAEGNVSFHSKTHDAVIVGERATYSEKEKKTEITGQPLLTKMLNKETIYLRAGIFTAMEKRNDAVSEQEIHALEGVKLYQKNLQGVADGAVYNSKSHTIHLHNKPIVWCGGYQITGEEMHLVIEEEQENVQMFVNKNLFMASADPVGNYNQIKGQKMVAYFKEGAIERMTINGNGESLYFVLDESNELMGMNYIKCNDMEIFMKDNTLERMECMPKPTGIFYPVALLTEEQMKLADFAWYSDQWPTKETILKAAEPIVKDTTAGISG